MKVVGEQTGETGRCHVSGDGGGRRDRRLRSGDDVTRVGHWRAVAAACATAGVSTAVEVYEASAKVGLVAGADAYDTGTSSCESHRRQDPGGDAAGDDERGGDQAPRRSTFPVAPASRRG